MITRSLLPLLLVALIAVPAVAQTPEDLDEIAFRLDSLAEEMQLLEELNTLQLTAVQVQSLQAEVGRMATATAPVIASRFGVLQQLEPLLNAKRAALIADRRPADDLLNQIGGLEEQLGDLDVQMDDAIVAFAPRLREILSEPQIALVSGEELSLIHI